MSPVLKQQLVGEHVRKLRRRAGLSLRALAAATEFSPSFISQLENGQVSPSIHSMEKIARALGASLGEFFASIEPGQGGQVTHVRERGRLTSRWSHAEIEVLSPIGPEWRLEPLLITLRPGGRSGKHPVPHQTEQFALVLKGGVTLRLGPDEHHLVAGDAVRLLPSELRLWTNDGRRDCQVLVVAIHQPTP
jgi:XRE family transcriptional regulator, regulator of sulfur utilization